MTTVRTSRDDVIFNVLRCRADILGCNGAEWSKDKTQAAESIKWRPQQAYGSNQFLLVQPQTVFSTHTKSSRSRIDKRTARATGNTRYRYSKIAPLDHKMADNCVSLARTNTLSSTITKLIKTSKTSNKSYSYNLLNRINKMYTHDLFYLQQEWEAWLAPVYIQIRTTKSQLTQVQNINVTKTYIGIKSTLPRLKWYITITIQRSVREARQTQRLALKQSVRTFAWGA